MSEGDPANESMMNVQSMSNNELLIIIRWTSTLFQGLPWIWGADRDPEGVSSTPLFLEGHTLTQTCEDSFLALKLLDQPVLLFVQINVEKVSFSALSNPLAKLHFKHLMSSCYVPGIGLTTGDKGKQGKRDVVFVLKSSHLMCMCVLGSRC